MLHLHGVANEHPAVLRAGHRALDEEQAAIGVGAHDFEVLLGALTVAHMAGHLLALEHAARILAVTRRTVRTVAERNAVRGAKTTEAPTLHGAGEALALRVTGDVDLLACDEMFGGDACTDRQKPVFALNAEFRDLHLQADIRLGEGFALRLVDVLLLGFTRAELDSEIAITVARAVSGNLAVLKSENGHGNVTSILLEQAGHPDFLCDHAGAHRQNSFTEAHRRNPKCVSARFSMHRPVRAELPSPREERDGGRRPG